MELLDTAKNLNRFLPPPFRRKPSWRDRVRAFLIFPFKTRRRRIALGAVFLLLTAVTLVTSFYAFSFYQKIRPTSATVSYLKEGWEQKDFAKISASLEELEKGIDGLRTYYSLLYFLRLVPWLGSYYADGIHALNSLDLSVATGQAVLRALEPYRETLGLGAGFGEGITVEQRMENLLGTLPSLADDLDLVWANLGKIREELNRIDPNRYPDSFRGVRVRFWLQEAQNVLNETEPLISRGKEVLELAPALLGSPKRTYLVLLQNDAELRATGGFITGFSLVTVEGGRVADNQSHSGAYFAQTYPPELGSPPPMIGKYLNVRKWHFQDANLSPDFPISAQTILGVWEKSGFPPVAGVMAINTKIVADLLNVTGPIRIPGYDRDLSKTGLPEDCRQGGRDFTSVNLVCRLEYYVEKAPQGNVTTEERKAIFDKFSDALIQKISTSSAEIWPQLFDFVFRHLKEKNLLVYAVDAREEALIRDLGYAGEIKEYSGDYLHINDSNFGGLKSDLYMQEEVEQSLQRIENGIWRKTVKIKYYNPVPYDAWLSGNYRDFVRIYVPKGSQLVSVDGSIHIWTSPTTWATEIQNPAGWEEFGKTVFGAYFTLWPQVEGYVLTFVYDLPPSFAEAMEDSGEYRLLFQKQPGTNIGLVKVQIGDMMRSVDLTSDQEIKISIER
uniref:DUF4012 domain-containing protein n=1 Tax=candidate division WWE3 bacterium TaxID=2053526 RepID=A0A831Z0T3_UNCKA